MSMRMNNLILSAIDSVNFTIKDKVEKQRNRMWRNKKSGKSREGKETKIDVLCEK